ncbi:MAG TPA: hypothetical protein VJ654_11070, partial [Noviherbaspirillum sp.]|nr:hypothetical protein [Noviherbaspirillum sp.]
MSRSTLLSGLSPVGHIDVMTMQRFSDKGLLQEGQAGLSLSTAGMQNDSKAVSKIHDAVGSQLERDAIGGFFELEFPSAKDTPYPNAKEFQSGRAAFLALLQAGRPRRVWMPYYICSTMLDSLRQADIDVAFYHIDNRFQLAEDIRLKDREWLVYVNYFGIRTQYARSLLSRFDPASLVIDSSQALFSPPLDCLATVYSPRKFLGIPDGGWLISSLPILDPKVTDDGSFERSMSLLKRGAFSAEEAYADHQKAERLLFHQEPKKMSHLTRRMLSGIDYQETCRIRNRNFAALHAQLNHCNALLLDPAEVNGALCYPLLTQKAGLREYLIKKRIFVPTYWKDVLELVSPSDLETHLVQELIPLPCDQRYG